MAIAFLTAMPHFLLRNMKKGLPGFLLIAATGGILFVSEPAQASDPQIVGSSQFSNQVYRAVLLLKTNDPSAYAIVTNYVGRIAEGKRSGMWAYKTPPTYEMSDRTALYSVTWCAATIAHDSYHSKLYHDYEKSHRGPVPDNVWSGIKAEQVCMKHQLAVMERIHAPAAEMQHARENADGNYVKKKDGWQDYDKRDW